MSLVKCFVEDESGATAIEYGLIAALIGTVIIAGASYLGTSIGAKFNMIGSNLSTAS